MQLLYALNQLLHSLDESEVLAVSTDHPLQSMLLARLQNHSLVEQTKGMWFNEYVSSIAPTSGEIVLPATALKALPIDRVDFNLIKRGTKMFDKVARTTILNRSVRLRIVEQLDFEDVPDTFAQFVLALAIAETVTIRGVADQAALQAVTARVEQARVAMHREHVQNSHANAFETPHTLQGLSKVLGGRIR